MRNWCNFQIEIHVSKILTDMSCLLQVYVWHTRTEKPKWKEEDKLIKMGKPSDPDVEV